MKAFAVTVLSRLFRPRPDPRERLRPLWHAIVARSRDPWWYREGGVADTVPGRFDMIAAILCLVLLRLEPDADTAAAQVFLTELFVEDMDGQLRETGVGDPVVGKHMGRLVSALGGRLGAFRTALAQGDASMAAAVARNMTLPEGRDPAALSQALTAFSAALADSAAQSLLDGVLPQ